jgi:hypothetical protein
MRREIYTEIHAVLSLRCEQRIHLQSREREIGHYVLTKFEAHFIDWDIWFFSLPYRMIKVLHDDDGDILELNKIALCDVK